MRRHGRRRSLYGGTNEWHSGGLLRDDADEFVPTQRAALRIEPLAIGEEAVLLLARLPDLHRDPFDRILVAQALAGGLTLVTPDEIIRRYPVRAFW